ncbi:DarT ssDNA thymidine ADP-ribosyltransferase family protein [Mesorhizobium sp. BHbdii]
MSAINTLGKIPFLYHFTDRRNVPLIREIGGLLPLSQLQEGGFKIPAPGGNDWSRDADAMKGMGNYVHLCFRNNHPMEYAARQDGRITDTIFLQIHASVIQFDGVRFTNDVSNKSGVESVPISEAEPMIDFEVLYARTNWSDPEIQQRLKQAEKYEVLVPSFIPISLIRNVPNG